MNLSFGVHRGGQNLVFCQLVIRFTSIYGADLPHAVKGAFAQYVWLFLEEGDVDMDVNYALEPDEIEKGMVRNP